jgi:Reverse transcriptase (RNA-dependent DNA polymerase)
LRICIDYHALNTVIMRDEYPLPRIDIIFDHLAKVKYFSTLDLNMVYHQVQLDDGFKEYTAFTCEERHFQFKVMIFGFTNAPLTFQYMITDYLCDIVSRFVKVYLNDILVYSETWKEHLIHLQLILECLWREYLFAKMSKYTWGKQSVKYLRHIISQGKLTANDDKVKTVHEWRKPTTSKELQ